MIICDRHKLLYLAPPKTGSVSIIRKLEHVAPFYGKRNARPNHAHHDSFWEERFSDYFIFMTVRHPYLRMLSLWQFVAAIVRDGKARQLKGPYYRFWSKHFTGRIDTFDQFLNVTTNIEACMRGVWSCRWHVKRMKKSLDAIVHQETFHEDLAKIELLSGVDFEHHNKGKNLQDPWHTYFEPRHALAVQDFWNNDFEFFGYNRSLQECREGNLFL